MVLSGAGGAHCHLCTATFKQLHDIELIKEAFPINRSISDAKELFNSVNKEEFLSLASNDRLDCSMSQFRILTLFTLTLVFSDGL